MPATSLDEERSRALVGAILGRFPWVAAAWIFGSFARGDASRRSDVDVGLLTMSGSPDPAPRELGAIAGELEAVFGGRSIDLVLLDGQSPIFNHEVLSDGKLVYEADRERRVDFESDVTTRYLDFKPTYDIAAARAVGGVRRWLDKRAGGT